MDNHNIAIEPKSFPEYESAVAAGGGQAVKISKEVTGLIWTDYSAPQKLSDLLDENPQIDWVQLPFAGVDAFADIIQRPLVFTSAKGCYSEPVAEHALALTLALCRAIPERVANKTWGRQFAVSLYESKILIVGGGGITEELLRLLKPFNTSVTVIRKRPDRQLLDASHTLGFSQLDAELPKADVVILTAALTPETKGLFDDRRFGLMKSSSYFVNIARGPIVVTQALEHALRSGQIAGAGIDVTDPEPLPDGHSLWTAPNLIVTPHSADTRPMVVRLFSKRIRANVGRYITNQTLEGLVDPQLGY